MTYSGDLKSVAKPGRLQDKAERCICFTAAKEQAPASRGEHGSELH